MGEIIATTNLKREKGYLYYVGTDDEGNLTLNRALMGKGRTKNVKEEE